MKNKTFVFILLFILFFAIYPNRSFAADSPSVLYVPLIGLTSVPDPLALPAGPGNVTYNYAVKNFLREAPLTNVEVIDDTCGHIVFLNGDDNGNSELDYSETWRYACTMKLSKTTQSTAMAVGVYNKITTTHKAYATVVVGTNITPPLVSIVNITKVAYPLSLPAAGGNITFTYRVNNPGLVPLSRVTVTDDKCSNMSGKLGDTNGNDLLDTNEVWIFTCTTALTRTTTNTATVSAFANDLQATDNYTLTVKVAGSTAAPPDLPAQITPSFPETGAGISSIEIKIIDWEIMAGVLAVLAALLIFNRKYGSVKNLKKSGSSKKLKK